MKFIILTLAMLIPVASLSDEICSSEFQRKLSYLSKKDPLKEAELLYCSGEPTIKSYSGIEYVIPGVTDKSSIEGMKVETVPYSDVVLCDEQSTYMDEEQKFIKAFNQKTVECKTSNDACCK